MMVEVIMNEFGTTKKKNKMNSVKLKEFLPIGTFLLIICSSIKLITFYNGFGINIINYIKLSEVTFSFLDDIYQYMTLFGVYVLWWVVDDLLISKRKQKKEEKENQIDGRNFVSKIIIQILLVSSICIISAIFIKKDYIIFMIGQVLLTIIFVFSQRKIHQFNSSVKYYALFFIVLAYTFFQAKIEVSRIKDNFKYPKVSIYINNTEIKSTADKYFIGKTEDYTFFYQPSKNKTLIYPNSEIERIEKGR